MKGITNLGMNCVGGGGDGGGLSFFIFAFVSLLGSGRWASIKDKKLN